MIHRALALAVLAGLLAAIAAGCGGDSGKEGSGPSAEALAIVRAADFARAVNLKASDVPYFEALPDDDEDEDPGAERRRQRRLNRCIGTPDEEPLAEVGSQTYGTEGAGELLQVESSVSVSDDAEKSAEAMELIRTPRAERCLRRLFLDLLVEEETPTAEARDADLEQIPFPAPEIGDGFAYRFSASVAVSGDTSAPVAYTPTAEPPPSQTIDIYIDLLGFLSGPAAISLNATGAPSPVSRNLERNLLRLLHERAAEQRP